MALLTARQKAIKEKHKRIIDLYEKEVSENNGIEPKRIFTAIGQAVGEQRQLVRRVIIKHKEERKTIIAPDYGKDS